MNETARAARNAYRREYYKANRERLRQYKKDWYAANKDRVREYNERSWEKKGAAAVKEAGA